MDHSLICGSFFNNLHDVIVGRVKLLVGEAHLPLVQVVVEPPTGLPDQQQLGQPRISL